MARRVSGWGFVALLVALGVFSLLGNVGLFAAYVLLLTLAVAFHAWYSCRRCNNASCTFNPGSLECMYGRRTEFEPPEVSGIYSNINAAVAGLPLLLVLALGFYGTYLFSVWALVAVAVLAAATGVLYTAVTCRHCTNNCPNNRNADYRAWRQTRRAR